MRLHRLLKTVLWSFFGVRRGADAARDLEEARPLTLIAVALLVFAVVVAGIVAIVRTIAPDRSTSSSQRPVVAHSTAAPARTPRIIAIEDSMEERTRPCISCHGTAGQTTGNVYSPRLAGKPAGYLFNQLRSFRDGRRTYEPMASLVRWMSDDYLREIASHFAGLPLPHPQPETAMTTPDAQARARELIERGDPTRGLPGCAACHGAGLTGIEPATPGLLGLPRDYIYAQFNVWQSGVQRTLPPDCMVEIALRLTPEDVQALANWLASRPVPPGAKAEPASRRALPMRCGGVEALDGRGDAVATQHDSSVVEPDRRRGEYLVTIGNCVACHTAIGGEPFAGGRAIETPFGTIYGSNITPDIATGIGGWSREQFHRALHDGRSRDGRLLYPAFPYPNFTRLTHDDTNAMFAYLQSVPAVSRRNLPNALRFPYDTQFALAIWRALFFQRGTFVADPALTVAQNRGAYLVHGLGHCDACHAERNVFGAVGHELDLGGGVIPMQKWYAPPLTSTAGADAAGWTAGDIQALLASGIAPRGSAMGPMAEVVYRSTQHLSAGDAAAIAAYLQASPSSVQPANRPAATADPRVLARGAVIYEKHCADCHGDDGQGASPAYPPLARNPGVTQGIPANPIKAVLNGGYPPATVTNPRPYGMPPFFGTLSDQQVADVLTFVRASWGNTAPPVSTLHVERYR